MKDFFDSVLNKDLFNGGRLFFFYRDQQNRLVFSLKFLKLKFLKSSDPWVKKYKSTIVEEIRLMM